jgi:diketogulonate reductase-like aldo/keto reductase
VFKRKPNTPHGVGWEQHVPLSDGTLMPMLGFGTQYGFSADGRPRGSLDRAADYVALALRTGLRLADTARAYGTEAQVTSGIEQSRVERSEVFVVTKAWPGVDHIPDPESSYSAIAESASRLGGYVDLFLVHHPVPGWQTLWRSLEQAKEDGLVKAIGVSNFKPTQLEELQSFGRYPAAVNQILFHPFVYRDQMETLRYCAEHGIVVMAYPRCPWQLGIGTDFAELAAARGYTIVQVMLRWLVEHGCVVIPLSVNEQHLQDNLAVRELRLSAAELARLDKVAEREPLRYAIDEINADCVAGWAFVAGGIVNIEILVDDSVIGWATYGSHRPDVAAAYASEPAALASGFVFHFPAGAFAKPLCEVSISFELANGEKRVVTVKATPKLAGEPSFPTTSCPTDFLS